MATISTSSYRESILSILKNPTPDMSITVVSELSRLMTDAVSAFQSDTTDLHVDKTMARWAEQEIPAMEDLIVSAALSIAEKDTTFGVTFAVWSGPPGTGKGTNIEAITIASKLLAEAYETSGRHIPDTIVPLIKSNTDKRASIITGTGGIMRDQRHEYKDIFGSVPSLVSDLVRRGDLVGDMFMTYCVLIMVLVRITQGARKIQFDLWPRTLAQLTMYDRLIVKLRVSGIDVYTEMINLRLLTQQEITAMKENILEYAARSEQIGKLKLQKMKEQGFVDEVNKMRAMDFQKDHVVMYEMSKQIVDKLISQVKEEMQTEEEVAARAIMAEYDRALERSAFRFGKAIEKKEIPRDDELPHSQLNRLRIFEMDTSPSVMRASLDHQIHFISSFQSPAKVVEDILDGSISKIEDGEFRTSFPEVWSTFLTVTGEIADAVVHRNPVDEEKYRNILVEVITR
jgi:adenylate kinase family enzyme